MKEPNDEGVANHIGSESCTVVRKEDCEALTGARMGRVLSRESLFTSRVPTPSKRAEGHIGAVASARPLRTLRGLRPRARADTSRAGTGRSRARLGAHQGRIVKSKDARR